MQSYKNRLICYNHVLLQVLKSDQHLGICWRISVCSNSGVTVWMVPKQPILLLSAVYNSYFDSQMSQNDTQPVLLAKWTTHHTAARAFRNSATSHRCQGFWKLKSFITLLPGLSETQQLHHTAARAFGNSSCHSESPDSSEQSNVSKWGHFITIGCIQFSFWQSNGMQSYKNRSFCYNHVLLQVLKSDQHLGICWRISVCSSSSVTVRMVHK